jgi:hypothetical protein
MVSPIHQTPRPGRFLPLICGYRSLEVTCLSCSLGGFTSANGQPGDKDGDDWTDQLGDQRMQIDTEDGNERPEHDRRQGFQNVAGNVPCHKVPVCACDQ